MTTIRKFVNFGWCLLWLLLNASSAWAELNLSPHEESFDLDGIKLTHLVFDNGTTTKATYQLPPRWSCSGSNDQLQILPADRAQADISITKVEPPNVIGFEEANHERLKQRAIASLPGDASRIQVESEEANPLQISGRDTYLVQLSYTRFGERFKRYFLLVNLTGDQLLCQLTSHERDYDNVMKAFQQSLYSWQHLT
jgi:hypothetical protein